MRTGRIVAAAGAAVALTANGQAFPARAEQHVGGGTAVIVGEARTPGTDCPPAPTGPRSCKGSWEGMYRGTFSGNHATEDDGHAPWWVVVQTPGEARLDYADPAPEHACDAAVLRGVATFTGGVEQVYGLYDTGGPLPRAVVGIRMTLGFEWHRDRLAGPLVLTSLRMEVDVYGVGPLTVIDETQQVSVADAVAAFVPHERGACVTSTPEVLEGVLSGSLSGIAVSSAN